VESDEFLLDIPRVRQLIADTRVAVARLPVAEALEQMRPAFAQMLADPSWLPDEYRRIGDAGPPSGLMASWLLFRSADRDLCLFSLVVPAGVASPIHDHLAWGLVGVYAGEQEEEVYRQPAPGRPLQLVASRRLRPGDFYVLLPPEEDIHRVRTLSSQASISIHLLGNDTGCTWRHCYELDGAVRPLRTGWYNRPCDPHGKPPPARPA
jgi:predicted metal-dependent enzyme (double-stranded beta helix superfamily)